MTIKSRGTDLGRRIAAKRLQKHFSQGMIARRTGLDPSYLSRIERDKVHPTVRTAIRIAEALRVPLSDLLDPLPDRGKDHPCPVSASGQCILELIEVGAAIHPGDGSEWYTPQKARLMQRFAAVLQNSSPAVLKAIEVLLEDTQEERPSKE